MFLRGEICACGGSIDGSSWGGGVDGNDGSSGIANSGGSIVYRSGRGGGSIVFMSGGGGLYRSGLCFGICGVCGGSGGRREEVELVLGYVVRLVLCCAKWEGKLFVTF